MREAIKPDMANIYRLLVNIRTEIKPVQELHLINSDDGKLSLINALPYYILTYGRNIDYLATLVKQPILKIALVGIAKVLEKVAGYYKIETKDIIKVD